MLAPYGFDGGDSPAEILKFNPMLKCRGHLRFGYVFMTLIFPTKMHKTIKCVAINRIDSAFA